MSEGRSAALRNLRGVRDGARQFDEDGALRSDAVKRIAGSRWFAAGELICVAAALALWEAEPGLGWKPLLLGLLPWLVRLLAGRIIFPRTPFDLPVWLFLSTAAVGAWAGYDAQASWAKFWLLVGAVLLYHAAAGQPEANRWLFAILLSLFGVGVSAYFFLTNDWSNQPVKVAALARLGAWWETVRPVLEAEPLHPNDVAGFAALALPFPVALAARGRRSGRLPLLLAGAGAAGFILIGVIFTASRGAWMAVGAVGGLWLAWLLSARLGRSPFGRRLAFLTLAILPLASATAGLALGGSGLGSLTEALGRDQLIANRLQMGRAALDLIGDFPFTGGGLDSFSGLYSAYILSIPSHVLPYSHNVFLDIALEQGLAGFLALAWVWLGSAWLLARRASASRLAPLRWAILAALGAATLHGLVDDVIYYTRHVPLLLVLPGMAVAAVRLPGRCTRPARRVRVPQRALAIGAALAIALAALGLRLRQPILAAWTANLGAVEMARVELADFPTGAWDDGRDLPRLAGAEGLFWQALQRHPFNRTANHRLGLIAMLRRDFPAAVARLEVARRADPAHRGIAKALAYSYVWAGQFDQALDLLPQIPEARDELAVYPWWWGTQGREDLSANAGAALARLEAVLAEAGETGEDP